MPAEHEHTANCGTDPLQVDLTAICKSIYEKLFAAYEAKFHARKIGTAEAEHPQQHFQGAYIGALSYLAGHLAVDAGMPLPTFMSIAAQSYETMRSSAPRFG